MPCRARRTCPCRSADARGPAGRVRWRAQPSAGQNFPNPFDPSTTILLELPRTAELSLVLHDDRGGRIRDLYASVLGPGTHPVQWDGRDDAGRRVASGTYRFVLRTEDRTSSRSLTLVR